MWWTKCVALIELIVNILFTDMAKKSNKRQLATDSNEFEKNDKKALENNDTPKKKKLKTNAEKPAKQNDSVTKAVSEKVETKNSIGKLDVNSSDNILEGKKSKKNKKKKTKEVMIYS